MILSYNFIYIIIYFHFMNIYIFNVVYLLVDFIIFDFFNIYYILTKIIIYLHYIVFIAISLQFLSYQRNSFLPKIFAFVIVIFVVSKIVGKF